jgi:hypothetical protein
MFCTQFHSVTYDTIIKVARMLQNLSIKNTSVWIYVQSEIGQKVHTAAVHDIVNQFESV